MNLLKKIRSKLSSLITNPFVLKWFFTLLAIVSAIILAFMLYMRTLSSDSLKHELTAYSEIQIERTATYLDDVFKGFQHASIQLYLDEIVNIYLFSEEAASVFPELNEEISHKLQTVSRSFPGIDSIYLYPASQKEVFASGHDHPVLPHLLYDCNWLPSTDLSTSTSYVFRCKDERYPYLISIYTPVEKAGKYAYIIVNINVSNISILNSEDDSVHTNLLISDEKQIIYRDSQYDMPEDNSIVPELAPFMGEDGNIVEYVDGKSPYIYAQKHSKAYPWYYVTLAKPRSFLVRPFDFYSALIVILPVTIIFAIILVIWLVLFATYPIRTINDFLDNPLSEIPDNISEQETQKIIRKFINYIQTNEHLSEELLHQMKLQSESTFAALQYQINPHFLCNTLNVLRNIEIEAFGYDHKVPNASLALGKILQYAFSSTELVTLRKEVYYAELYAQLLNMRYENQIQCIFDIDPDVAEVRVPKLILQPLIENAIFHGCAPQINERSEIMIQAKSQAGVCILRISDNGFGMTEEVLESIRKKISNTDKIPADSIGLPNVAFRIHLTYGEASSIEVKSEQHSGTCITLSIPSDIL